MRFQYYLAIVATISVLSACGIHKDYVRPKIGVPERFQNVHPALQGDSVSLPWQHFFKDPILAELIDSSLQRNTDMQVALLNLEQADNSRKQARLGMLPQLNLLSSVSRNYPSKNSLNGSLNDQFVGTSHLDDFSISGQLSWEADVWGKISAQKHAANVSFLNQQQSMLAVKTRLIAEVAQAYYNLLTLDMQLRVAEKNIGLTDSTLQMMTLRYNSGAVNSVAVSQAEAQKKTAQLLSALTEQNIEIQENALNILAGRFPEPVKRVSNVSIDDLKYNAEIGIPADLLSRRPDVRASELALVVANAQVGIQKASLYPSLSITVQSGLNSFKTSNWFNIPASLFHTFAGNLTQPIFQRNQLKTAYKNAILEKDKAVTQFRQSMLTAVGEVSDALVKADRTAERYELAEVKKKSLEKAVSDARLLYNNGMANYLEVITAQSESLQSEIELSNIVNESLQSNIMLYRALGGGTN